MNPAELSGVGVVIVQTKNCLGIQKVLNGDEDDTNENQERSPLVVESEQSTLNPEVIHHEPLEDLVQHGQGIDEAAIRRHDGSEKIPQIDLLCSFTHSILSGDQQITDTSVN